MQSDSLSLYKETIGCSIEVLAAKIHQLSTLAANKPSVVFRIKNMETLRKKMTLKGSSEISSIDDIYGIRVLVDSTEEIYGTLQRLMLAFPGYIDHDYVTTPKINPNRPGKALRLVQYIAKEKGLTFEVQITTHAWNEINEKLHEEYHQKKYT